MLEKEKVELHPEAVFMRLGQGSGMWARWACGWWLAIHPGVVVGAEFPPNPSGSGEESRIDWELASRVRALLHRDPDLSSCNLRVLARDGIVTLEGPVLSGYVKMRAGELARKVRGVRGVYNDLRVRRTPPDPEPAPKRFPPIDRWENSPEPTPPKPAPPSDSELPDKHLMSRSPGEKPEIAESERVRFQVRRFLNNNPQFAEIQFVERDGDLILGGSVYQASDLADLLEALEAIPGVRRVDAAKVRVVRR